MSADDLRTLARLCGVELAYRDNFGHTRTAGSATLEAVLTAMGVPCGTPAARRQSLREIQARREDRLLPEVTVIPPGARRLPLWLRGPGEVIGEIISDTGERLGWMGPAALTPGGRPRPAAGGGRLPAALKLPYRLTAGYYDLKVQVAGPAGEEEGRTRLVVAPPRAYLPEPLEQGARWWGLNVPLYALRSASNWGIGDFQDLKALTRLAGDWGAAFVGVNPLHARPPEARADPSPYSPASRLFVNFLYIDPETVPELHDAPEVRDLLAHPAFRAHVARLRETPLVAYGEVHRLKHRVLRMLFTAFRRRHGLPSGPRTPRGEALARFVAQGGENLQNFALFQALGEFFGEADWRRWPDDYRHPAHPAAAAFARRHPEETAFHCYVQWLAAGQREEVWAEAARAGLPFTLYQDLALGAAAGGFETWAYPELFSQGAAMGAPPDAFNPKGQNWGLPPLIPDRLTASGYRLFIDTLRANLPPGGMVRLDHVMALFRLFWIPPGLGPDQGAYVRYPAGDLLAVLALESHRRRTLIIGEDLGTVAPRVRRELSRARVLSYRVFYFERQGDRSFTPPEAYPPLALAAVTTHDLPTLAGYWQGEDLQLKKEHNLFPNPEAAAAAAASREADRQALVQALGLEHLLPRSFLPSRRRCPPALRRAVLSFLARSRAALLEVRLEDLTGETRQQNLPGTTWEHPNWRLKLPVTLEDLARRRDLRQLAQELSRLRPCG
jgi:4-alpha-glucanotransferase